MDKPKDKVGEPDVPYGQERLTFFSSFDEERKADLAYWKSLSPIERMEEHRKLSLVVFSGFKKYTGNRLTFD